jgi:hypothetical protein
LAHGFAAIRAHVVNEREHVVEPYLAVQGDKYAAAGVINLLSDGPEVARDGWRVKQLGLEVRDLLVLRAIITAL